MPKGDRTPAQSRSKPKAKSKSGRVTKPSAPPVARTSGAGYNSVVSGGLTNTRISGAHYAMSQGPPAVFMSDDEEDSNIKEMMRTVNVSKTISLILTVILNKVLF
jgi:hypothetical protein